MTVRERIPVAPYGELAQSEDGVLWAKYPDDLWGDLSKCVQLALRALLKLWDGLTVCEPTREELRIAINELREEKNKARAEHDPPLRPLPMIQSKRTISWYFSKLEELGVIERARVDGKRTEWYTKFKRSFYAKLGVAGGQKAAVQVGQPVPSGPQAVPTKPCVIDLSYGSWFVEEWAKHGYSLSLDSGGNLRESPIEGAEQRDLRDDARRAKEKKENTASIVAFLKQPVPHQRE